MSIRIVGISVTGIVSSSYIPVVISLLVQIGPSAVIVRRIDSRVIRVVAWPHKHSRTYKNSSSRSDKRARLHKHSRPRLYKHSTRPLKAAAKATAEAASTKAAVESTLSVPPATLSLSRRSYERPSTKQEGDRDDRFRH